MIDINKNYITLFTIDSAIKPTDSIFLALSSLITVDSFFGYGGYFSLRYALSLRVSWRMNSMHKKADSANIGVTEVEVGLFGDGGNAKHWCWFCGETQQSCDREWLFSLQWYHLIKFSTPPQRPYLPNGYLPWRIVFYMFHGVIMGRSCCTFIFQRTREIDYRWMHHDVKDNNWRAYTWSETAERWCLTGNKTQRYQWWQRDGRRGYSSLPHTW